MNKQLGNLLMVGGLIAAGYFVFNRMTNQALSLATTRKLLQQIKHQILIVTINFAEGSDQHLIKVRASHKQKQQEFIDYFRSKLSEIYVKKQQLILGKYQIPRQKFAQSLNYHSKDPRVAEMQKQIIDMMDKAVHGQVPNLQVDKRASKAFTKQQIRVIYEDMSKMILVSLISKLQQQKSKNQYFDSNNDNHFKKAIRQLNIYDKKIQFFKQRGFKEQWGCPNQIFFKLSQGLKIQDPQFKKQMKKLEEVYEQVVDVAAKDPMSLNIQSINEFYIKKQKQTAEQQQKAQQNQININQSTKSEPDLQQKIQQQAAYNLRNNDYPTNEFQKLKMQRYASVPVQSQAQKQQVVQAVNHINIDDIPADAHQLQKQMHEQNPSNPPVIQVPEQLKKFQESECKSNASVDGEKNQNEVQPKEVVHVSQLPTVQ